MCIAVWLTCCAIGGAFPFSLCLDPLDSLCRINLSCTIPVQQHHMHALLTIYSTPDHYTCQLADTWEPCLQHFSCHRTSAMPAMFSKAQGDILACTAQQIQQLSRRSTGPCSCQAAHHFALQDVKLQSTVQLNTQRSTTQHSSAQIGTASARQSDNATE